MHMWKMMAFGASVAMQASGPACAQASNWT